MPKLNRSLHPPYSFTRPKELKSHNSQAVGRYRKSLSVNVQNKFYSVFLTSAQWRALKRLSAALQQAKLTWESTDPAVARYSEPHSSLVLDSTHSQDECDHCGVLTTASN